MKKSKTIALFMAFIMVLGLTACDGDYEPPERNEGNFFDRISSVIEDAVAGEDQESAPAVAELDPAGGNNPPARRHEQATADDDGIDRADKVWDWREYGHILGPYVALNDVRNGNVRASSFHNEDVNFVEYSIFYYQNYFDNNNQVHGIVNSGQNIVIRLSVSGNNLSVKYYEFLGDYVDAKTLFAGKLYANYKVNLDNGEITSLMTPITPPPVTTAPPVVNEPSAPPPMTTTPGPR